MKLINSKNVIVYELNEVPQRVFDHYKELRPRSNIASLMDEGVVHSTYAVDDGILSPWITWPTTHRGVSNAKHCISDFGQDLAEVNAEFPPVWELLARSGVKVGLFGSLHSYPLPKSMGAYDFYVPDTFAAGSECFPESLSCFQRLNLQMVDASSRNVSGGFPVSTAMEVLLNAPGLGLRPRTAVRVAKQLLSERFDRTRVVRRRTTQVELAFDLFFKQLLTNKPAFSSFFTNHVASAMHRYWPATFRDDHRELRLPESWKEQFSSEIDFTMDEADYQLGRLKEFVDKNSDYSLVVLTSMGQAAVEGEIIHSQLLVDDLRKFLKALGSSSGDHERQRAMSPRYVMRLDADSRSKVVSALSALRVNGSPVEWSDHGNGIVMIKLGHANIADEDIKIDINGVPVDWREIGLSNTSIQDATGSYAYHIPQGVMMVYAGGVKGAATDIPTSSICPMFLDNFSVRIPDYMSMA